MLEPKHILSGFDDALSGLHADALMMASLTERSLTNAMSCLLQADSDLCVRTIADEDEINALQKKIDGDGIEILLRFQPYASDLRQVIASMRFSSNVERVADQAVKVARRSRRLIAETGLKEVQLFEPIFLEALILFRDSVRAFASNDVALARSIRERDRKLDELNQRIARDLTHAMSSGKRITDYLNLIFIARHLERVGDHAKNIGEDTVYVAEALDIRHPNNSMEVELSKAE
jgi:phosphate transport system protein